MNNEFKSNPFFTIVLLLITSCNSSNELSLDNEEGIAELKQILTEQLNVEMEVYSLNFSAELLTGRLESIAYSYELKGEIFEDKYTISVNRFSDPIKYPNRIYKPFKIKEAPISIIPAKYKEALEVLDKIELLKDDEEYYLDHWVFKTDKNGKFTSSFNVNYYINTERSGKVLTTNYGQYSFIMNGDQSLKLIK